MRRGALCRCRHPETGEYRGHGPPCLCAAGQARQVDAADAVAEGFDVEALLRASQPITVTATVPALTPPCRRARAALPEVSKSAAGWSKGCSAGASELIAAAGRSANLSCCWRSREKSQLTASGPMRPHCSAAAWLATAWRSTSPPRTMPSKCTTGSTPSGRFRIACMYAATARCRRRGAAVLSSTRPPEAPRPGGDDLSGNSRPCPACAWWCSIRCSRYARWI